MVTMLCAVDILLSTHMHSAPELVIAWSEELATRPSWRLPVLILGSYCMHDAQPS